MGLSSPPTGARTPGRARGLVGLRAERVAQTLILKGGLVRHPLGLHADPMASPWPALGLLSITCCSCCRCVPGRINSRPCHVLLCFRGLSRRSLACPFSDALSSAVPEPLPGSECLGGQPRPLGPALLHCCLTLRFYHRSPSTLLARPPSFPAPFQQQPFRYSVSKACQAL